VIELLASLSALVLLGAILYVLIDLRTTQREHTQAVIQTGKELAEVGESLTVQVQQVVALMREAEDDQPPGPRLIP
jgi:hypothetical protein